MQLNFNDSASNIYKRAFDIGESCGYMVEGHPGYIDILGEDCQDQFYIINRLHIKDKKIIKASKLVFKYADKKLVKTLDLINGEWIEPKN